MKKKKVEGVYDWMAPVYYWVFGFSLDGARRRALQKAKIRPGEKILEVGVGTGMTFNFLPPDIDFTGVDLSEKMLDVARKRAATLSRKYKLLQMNATKLDFPDESFDLVISAHFLSATSNPLPALMEMKRVVKKNGRILIVNTFAQPTTALLGKALEPLARAIGFSVKVDLKYLLQATGLHVHDRLRASRIFPIDAVILTP